jgi:lysyl-tRNA synthetase class 1
VAPEGAVEDSVLRRLASYGLASAPSDDLSRRIGWAVKWAKREGTRALQIPDLSPTARKAVRDFANTLLEVRDADGVQNAAFDAAKRNGLKPGEFFPAVYSILLGSNRGPRLGPYIIDAGRAEVSRALLDATGK